MRFFEASFFEPNSINVIFMHALLLVYNSIKYLISNKVDKADKQTQTEFWDESSSSDEDDNKTLRYLRINLKLQEVID